MDHIALNSLLSRFRRRTDGIAAIEAAFIVPIFFALVFSTMEVGWVYFKTTSVERLAAEEAAREIRTGKAFRENFEVADAPADCPYGTTKTNDNGDEIECGCTNGKECFFEERCKSLKPFLRGPCQDQLSVEVKRYDSFAAVAADTSTLKCPNDDGYKFSDVTYAPGVPRDIVRLRLCFTMKLTSPVLGAISFGTGEDNTYKIKSVQLLRSEPYLNEDESNPNDQAGS